MNKQKIYEKYLFMLCVIFGTIIMLTILNAIPTHALDCPPKCPEASEWSNCTEGFRSRLEYKCSNETDYFCQASKVSASCKKYSTPFWVIVAFAIAGTLVMSGIIIKKPSWRSNGKKESWQ